MTKRLLMITLLLAACGSEKPHDASAVAGDSTAQATRAAAPADSADWTVYACESGKTVEALYPAPDPDVPITVRYDGVTYTMHTVRSASGARYAGGGYEWWTKGIGPGSTGMLGRFPGGDTTAVTEPLEQCEVPAGQQASIPRILAGMG